MLDSVQDKLHKGLRYFFLPLAFPGHFFPLASQVLTRRSLVHELAHLVEHRQWFESRQFRTVVDVGAYIGSFSYAMHTLLPEAQIYAFEPLPDHYAALQKNMAGVRQFRAFHTALGETAGNVDFWKNDFSASSSVLPIGELHTQAFPQTAGTHLVSVPMRRLDDFLPEMNLRSPVLLKLDVQGYEEVVLSGGLDLLRQADYLLVEVSYHPLYEGQVLFDRLYDFLRQNGMLFAGIFDTLYSPVDGIPLQSNALFVRQVSGD
ncbi:MAG: FkbM family methyltransferase [Anaerolineaceae bacterium]|nr:FkbM family methyltransferase [Anaerolineaceae bacterium]